MMQTLEMQPGKGASPGQGSGPVIRVIGLTKRFKKALAVDGAEFEVPPGDVFGLLGPNGAGKTTVIRMLLGLITPTAGRAEVFGFDPIRQRREVLSRVAAIVESPALYPTLSGRDNLKAMALASGIRADRKIEEVLDRLGMAGRAKDKYSTYSLGMKQRLCIAAALLTEPQLIILDEPTNGLDPAGMAEVRQLIHELAGQGRTILLSSHLLNEVQQVCNRVGIIQRGRIIQQGLVFDLLSDKTTIQVRVKPGDRERAWHILEHTTWAGRLRNEGSYIVVDWPADEGAAINEALAANGIFASEITPRGQTLEEYYLRTTGQRAEPDRKENGK